MSRLAIPVRRLSALCVALSMAASPATAQEAATPADWDLVRDERQKVVMAYTVFDVGLGVTVRCHDGVYDAVIGGLPPAGDRQTRRLAVAFGDGPRHEMDWNVAVEDTMAVSPLPAPLARRLREGGRMQIVVPGGAEGGRNLRYDLELPASSAAIDETLTACGRPLADPRDAELEALGVDGLFGGVKWLERPRPEYPMGMTTYTRGFATVTCLTTAEGRLRDCVTEAEHPRDAGFGEAVVRSTRRARLGPLEGEGPVPVRRIYFRTNFYLEGYDTAEDRQRRREARAAERDERARSD